MQRPDNRYEVLRRHNIVGRSRANMAIMAGLSDEAFDALAKSIRRVGQVARPSPQLPFGFAYPEHPSTHPFHYPALGGAIVNGFASEQPKTAGTGTLALDQRLALTAVRLAISAMSGVLAPWARMRRFRNRQPSGDRLRRQVARAPSSVLGVVRRPTGLGAGIRDVERYGVAIGFALLLITAGLMSWMAADFCGLLVHLNRGGRSGNKPLLDPVTVLAFAPIFLALCAVYGPVLLHSRYDVDPAYLPGTCGDTGVDYDIRDGLCYRNVPMKFKRR